MKNIILAVTAVVAAIALGISVNGLFRIRSQACRTALDACEQECDRTRDRALNENQSRRTQIMFQLQRDLLACRIDNFGNDVHINECQTEKSSAADANLARLEAADDVIRTVRQQCITGCIDVAKKCDYDSIPRWLDLGGAHIDVPAEIECLEGGAPCFKEVLDICKRISGPCDDCWRSLCGGGDWLLEGDVPLDVTLWPRPTLRKTRGSSRLQS